MPYTALRVPPHMPRPVLASLGINHRRIPILSLGRDVYIDTKLIIRKLETLYLDGKLGSDGGFEQGFERMLEDWVNHGGPFWRTAGCIPVSAPLVQSDVWMKDRADGSGGHFSRDTLKNDRGWNLSQVRSYFGMMELMLSDERTWLLNTERPGLAEVHGCWVYDWGISMGSAMDVEDGEMDASVGDMAEVLSEKEFPYVHAWVKRFGEACDEAAAKNRNGGHKQMLEGAEAESETAKKILSGDFAEKDEGLIVGESDALGLKRGQRVTIAPTDFGFTHSDEGVLVALGRDEVVIEVDVTKETGNGKLRLHFPRLAYKIVPVEGAEKQKERV